MQNKNKKKFAIVSVFDKSNLETLVQGLSRNNFSIISTGKTYKAIEKIKEKNKLNIDLLTVQEITHFPECLSGRVKTLHPVIEGGIVYDRNNPVHCKEAKDLGFPNIELLVCNLYPFEEAVKKQVGLSKLIEVMDIGGPTMIMCAIKNFKHVGVITDPNDYKEVTRELNCGALSRTTKRELATKAINLIADYRAINATELSKLLFGVELERINTKNPKKLRYGENPHQKANFFSNNLFEEINNKTCNKEMSYNNYLDASAAFRVISELKENFKGFGAVVMKHQVPCGIATGINLETALDYAIEGDPVSAFGSVIAFSHVFNLNSAELLCKKKNMQGKRGWFVEVILAPEFNQDALDYFTSKKAKKNVRLIKYNQTKQTKEYKVLDCGILEQEKNTIIFNDFQIVSNCSDCADKIDLFKFAYFCVKHTKSNAFAIAREYRPDCYQLAGLGAGQPSRINSAKLALELAKSNFKRESPVFVNNPLRTNMFARTYSKKLLTECVAASEAFFPFCDVVDFLNFHGIQSVIQPGGAKRDREVIDAVNSYKMMMVFTNTRHFLH